MALRDVTLDDKYDLGQRHIFVTGFQALVRLCLMQKELDRRNGLNTAGFVTGYRGSPLGNLDSQFLRAKRFLEKSDVRFQGGINEDLAATAVWGSQQAELRGERAAVSGRAEQPHFGRCRTRGLCLHPGERMTGGQRRRNESLPRSDPSRYRAILKSRSFMKASRNGTGQ